MDDLMNELYRNNEIKKIQKIQYILSKTYINNINTQILFNYACSFNNLDIVEYLLEHDKTIDIHFGNNKAFRIACRVGSIELMDILIKYGEFCIFSSEILRDALHGTRISIVKYLINYSEMINEKYNLNYLFNKPDTFRYNIMCYYNEVYSYSIFSYISFDEIIEYLIYLDKHNYKFIISPNLSIMWSNHMIHKNINNSMYVDKYIFNNNILCSLKVIHSCNMHAYYNNYILYPVHCYIE